MPPPDGGLKPPMMKFEDTFSAETVIMKWFFKDQYAQVDQSAESPDSNPG